MSFTHTIEAPAFVPPNKCISCEKRLGPAARRNKRSLCINCTNEAMIEHTGIILTNYGEDLLKRFMQKAHYQKYNHRRKLLMLRLNGN